MKLIYRCIYLFIITTTLGLFLNGCFNSQSDAPDDPSQTQANVTISLTIPDYHKLSARVIDPATSSLEITVTAADMTAVTKIITSNGSWSNGSGTISGDVQVPTGTARHFSLVTKDNAGNSLTAGSATVDVVAGTNAPLQFYLLPEAGITIAVSSPQTINSSVAAGRMNYYQVHSNGATWSVSLSGANTGLFIFSSGGLLKPVGSMADDGDFLGVYGSGSGRTAPYSLTTTISATPTPTNAPTPTPGLPVPFPVMIRVPGAASFTTSSSHTTNPISDDSVCTTVNYAYYIAQTEVTYQQWSTVYDWAVSHGYTFANPGSRGGYYNTSPPAYPGTFTSGHETDPVTTISWRDAIVWCNALTEYYNNLYGAGLGCVYQSAGNPIRNSTDAATCDAVIPDISAKGYRLPLSMEWELAARYKDGTSWTPGSFASGATDNYTSAAANNSVAWYSANSNISAANLYSTQPVGSKTENSLNLRDMSGNVWEWCSDKEGSQWILRGGSWYHPNTRLELGYIYYQNSGATVLNDAGFRFVRTE